MNDIPAGFNPAAPWSLFVGDLGRASVYAAIALFAIAAVGALRPRFERASTVAFVLGCLAVFTTFGCIASLFLTDQFQYGYVWEHSAADSAVAYKIASVWTEQWGSLLLWTVGASAFALAALRGTGPYRRGFVGVSSLLLGATAAILTFESAFKIMPQIVAHGKTFVPPVGNGMVPSLQNYWVIIHPPVIFFGFGSLSMLAAYAVAAMLHRDAKDWVARVRPWALLSVAVLGLGIALGGLWAYETQGWGGFWAWDPVENVSFVPWLLTIAFAHGLIVQASRGKWAGTNLFLGGVPFLLFLYGTYLTRSGLLDKVSNHSFATMDDHARGFLKIFLLAALGLFAAAYVGWGRGTARMASAEAQPDEPGVSRENAYRYGMMLISLLGLVISLGMSWPVVTALRGGQGSRVEESLYHLVVVWFFLPLMALMAVGPFVAWRRMESKTLRERLFGVLCVSCGATGLLHLGILSRVHLTPGATVAMPFGARLPLPIWMLVLLFSVVFVVVANVWRVADIVRRSPMGVGGFLAHAGLATLLGGLILSRGYERTEQITVRDGAPATAMGYTVAFRGPTTKDFSDRGRKVEFDVTTPNGTRFVARPGHYRAGPPGEEKDQVWPSIERYADHDVYLSMLPPVILATPEPILMRPGDRKEIGDATVEYLAATNNGKFGAAGAEFGVKLRLTQLDANGEPHQYVATPAVGITDQGLAPVAIPKLGPDLRAAIMGGVDAADHSARIALLFSPPLYRIDLYEKPFTGLVWLGTGIMTFGGLMSAFARRRVAAARRRTAPAPRSDAPLPTA